MDSFNIIQNNLWREDKYRIIEYVCKKCDKPSNLPPLLSIEVVKEKHFPMLLDNWPPSVSYLGRTKDELEKLLQERLNKKDIGIICFIEDKFIGMSWMSMFDLHMVLFLGRSNLRDYCWKNVYVIPEYRRSGIAIVSYNFAVELLEENGGKRMYGFVQKGNEKSINFVTRSLEGRIIGNLVFKYRLGFTRCYYEDLNGDFKKLYFPRKGKFLY